MSGTPTVVWRRTGEICLVGPEFYHLTGWSREDLIARKTYIYEVRGCFFWSCELFFFGSRLLTPWSPLLLFKQLFENQSVVEYWEAFASHAFENTTQSVYTHCVVLKPDGTPIPSTFSFSIRRDLFDLPSIVIGTCCHHRHPSLHAEKSLRTGQWLPLL